MATLAPFDFSKFSEDDFFCLTRLKWPLWMILTCFEKKFRFWIFLENFSDPWSLRQTGFLVIFGKMRLKKNSLIFWVFFFIKGSVIGGVFIFSLLSLPAHQLWDPIKVILEGIWKKFSSWFFFLRVLKCDLRVTYVTLRVCMFGERGILWQRQKHVFGVGRAINGT